VEVVDMREARRAVHPRTHEALVDARKAIVLLNRRGWSNFLSCRSCGQVWECPSCDVTLVLHRAAGRLACHHCGHREPVPARCCACGSISIARHGAGTQRLEHELDGPVFRLDADVGDPARVLAAFEAADRGVLVGTQMVAKGHDFPDVELGVVLDADATLRFPDFRAEERTFALVTQLAGRAGRGPRGGRVLVQTITPEAESIRLAAAHDADAFLAAELERRALLRYPPFSTLVRVVCSSPRPGAAQAAARDVHRRMAAAGLAPLGPAPLFRLRGRERSQVVVKAAERAPAVAAIGGAVETTAADRAHRAAAFSVDVDPQ
jgi:primosomal protein N' (replication factor Y)